MELSSNGSPEEPRPTIVLVDDDPLIGDIVTEILESAGYTVVIADDGADAIDLIWRVQPALAILDCALPGRPGMVVLGDLRSSPMFQNLPVVMLTGRRSEWHEAIALEKGVDAYVRKPFEAHDLIITIAKLLRPADPPSTQPAVA